MTTKEIVDCMLRRMDALSDSMSTTEGMIDAHRYAALEGLNNMIEECAKKADWINARNELPGTAFYDQSTMGDAVAQVIRSLKAENPVYDLDR